MTTTTRSALAACLFTAIVAGALAPRITTATGVSTHGPHGPGNLQVSRVAGNAHNAIVVSWDKLHFHPVDGSHSYTILNYEFALLPNGDPAFCLVALHRPVFGGRGPEYMTYPNSGHPRAAGCILRTVPLDGSDRYSETVTGLKPDTSYTIWVVALYTITDLHSGTTLTYGGDSTVSTPAATATITTASPPDPETPAAASQTCTYKHRLIGVPGASTYAGRILVSSEKADATATIRAYQGDNGHPLDVLDADGRAAETIELDPANSIKRFTLEGAEGWHTVIVEHPSASAMSAATVTMRYRDTGGNIEDTYAPAVEHCQPASSTGPVTQTDSPTEPETPSPPGTETPAPPDPVTPEPETPAEPEPETPAEPETTAPELAVTLTRAVRDSAGKVAVSGTVTNAGTTASASTRIRFLNGRRRIHTATVPAIAGSGVHAISADVTMPEGSAVQVCLVPKGRDADPSNDCDTAAVTTGQ